MPIGMNRIELLRGSTARELSLPILVQKADFQKLAADPRYEAFLLR